MPKNMLPQNMVKVPIKVSQPVILRDVIYKCEPKEKFSGICLTEMSQLFICFKNYSFNQEACAKEIEVFQNCYNEKIALYRNQKKGSGSKMTNEKVNKLLERYCDKRSKKL